MAEMAQRLPFKLEWIGYNRLDLIGSKPHTIQLLKDSGLKSSFFGIESFHSQASKIVGKGWNGVRGKEFLIELKERWGITTFYQLLLIIAVFAINGSLSARISNYLLMFIGINDYNTHWFIYYLILLVLVLPIYPFLLMGFGYLFGQSKFFFPFGKRMLSKIGLEFIFKKKAS
jgi:hypothetical protein